MRGAEPGITAALARNPEEWPQSGVRGGCQGLPRAAPEASGARRGSAGAPGGGSPAMAESSRWEPGARSARPGCCRTRRRRRRKRPHSARTARPGRSSISASPPPSAASRHRHRLRGRGVSRLSRLSRLSRPNRHRRELRPRTGYRNPLPPRPAVVSPRTASPRHSGLSRDSPGPPALSGLFPG